MQGAERAEAQGAVSIAGVLCGEYQIVRKRYMCVHANGEYSPGGQ